VRNKSTDKTIYNKYKQNDLYKCFLMNIIDSDVLGGIIIIPLNFWCSIRKGDKHLKKLFIDKFKIIQLNIFEERVFDDIAYSVCCFQFEKSEKDNSLIKTTIYPKKTQFNFILNDENDFIIGGEVYNLEQDKEIKIERLTKKNIKSENTTNICVR